MKKKKKKSKRNQKRKFCPECGAKMNNLGRNYLILLEVHKLIIYEKATFRSYRTFRAKPKIDNF